MAHKEQKDFFEKVKQEYPEYFKNKMVLDVGSLDVNGTHKHLFDDCSYIGLDIGEGPNVDVVSIGHLYDAPDDYFDVIISGSVFEHDMFYEKTINNIMRMLKPGGLFLFTCGGPGYPEHGTRKSGSEFDAPLLSSISEEWADYYKNLSPDDVKEITNFQENFPDGYFEIKSTEIAIPSDLYFYGFKGGEKYINTIEPEHSKEDFQDHIFVIDSWPDNESKENDLVNLIKQLKVYNIPILLTGHYPIKEEIQKLVDYYIFDKDNPILLNEDFSKYGVSSGRWTNINDTSIKNQYPYHHDYAIWETMRNAFNFCDYLGKKYIHFMEYDNLPDKIQYRQAFLEKIIMDFDAVMYEYDENSTKENPPYSSAYIFSIKTHTAIKAIDTIKSKKEYFQNRPNGWQLEKILYNAVNSVTSRIHISEYIPNDNELNTQAVWGRDGVDRNGARFQVYLCVDEDDNLYAHIISGFHLKPAEKDYLIEVDYNNSEFHTLKKGSFITKLLGKYKIGKWVRMYYEGVEVFNEFLGDNVENFRKFNTIDGRNDDVVYTEDDNSSRVLNIHFIDGPFIEILEPNTHRYHVQFINAKTNKVVYELDLESNHWAKANIKYHMDWLIKVRGIDNDLYSEYRFDPKGKKILISFESKSLGDTLSWVPFMEKFAEINECTVVCSTFINELFEKQYPNIKFIKPGESEDNIYCLYRIGLYFDKDDDSKTDFDKNPTDPRKLPLGKICSDIIGLEYEELKPRLPLHKNIKKKKQVSIGIHSTAQCKYWNNPTGWQEVVDYLKSKDYDVILLSREEDGFMGNKNPKGVKKHRKGPISNVIKTIQESELFIGISGGLSWLSWSIGTPTILISGFTEEISEPRKDIHRIINKDVCHGCWSHNKFERGIWDWCPEHQHNEDRKFECSKKITSETVIKEIDKILKIN